MNGVQDIERRRLLETAKVTAEDSQSINNLALFSVVLSSTQTKEKGKSQYNYWGNYKQERKKKKKTDDSLPYDLSRYVPLIKRLVQVEITNKDQINNNVPKDEIPWVLEPKSEDLGITSNSLKMFRFASNGIVPPDPNYPLSLRTTRASWTGRARTQQSNAKEKPAREQIDWRKNGPRIILFSLGGLTYSEVRSAYELSKEAQREIFFGSTFIYNPIQFLDVLRELHKTDVPNLASLNSPSTNAPPDLGDKKGSEKEKDTKGVFVKRK